jgi:polysaccharide pyruvyl transferase WcaK-like protein
VPQSPDPGERTTAETSRRPRVLAVGAYERDNFGDLLFLLVTERYLTDADVVATAPFSADMTELLDREVAAYGPLLRDEPFDVVWTVGGQVGGTDLRSAFRMSAPPETYRVFQRSSAEEQARMLREAVGDVPVVSPYIPSLAQFPKNAGAISVLNSVGVSGIRGAKPSRREELVALLRGQTFISVRDKESSDYLNELGIEHRLVPDAVHAISLLRPAERNPRSDVAIVQGSRAIFGKLGHANVAAKLVESEHLKGLRIRFLLAGAASGHDSFEDCQAIVDHARRLSPTIDIGIITDRRPYDLVDHMRQARVVIGTSLHVRIIACSYGVPRVTLSRTKPTRYARVWDPDMPFDVSLDELDSAIGRALANAERPEVLKRSQELSRLAHENLTDLADRVLTMARTQTDADRQARAELRRQVHTAMLAERARQEDIQRLERELEQARKELAAIRSSRGYRLLARGARVSRAIRRSLARAKRASRGSTADSGR